MIKISVILPVYNEELYLHQCLDSICGQTLREIEIICVDDGSTDGSLDILNSYAKQDTRIKVLTQENQYAGAARNYGMQNAKGKYLLFLDSDDYFESNMLEKLYEAAENNQLDIVMCRYNSYDDFTGKEILLDFSKKDSFLPKGMDVFSGKDLKEAGIFQVAVGWAWDKLLRREFVQKCSYIFPEFRSSEDGFFVYMLMAKAERIGIVSDRMVHHRVNNLNSLSNTKELDWENGFKMLKLIARELQEQKLYHIFQKSFVSFAIEFQVWYLQSMHEKEAFSNCYKYIKEDMEQEFRFLQFQGTFLCEKQILIRYHQILDMELWEFLFMTFHEKEDVLSKARQKGWVFPYARIPKGCRLVVYGAGAIGQAYWQQLLHTGYCSEVYLIDKDYKRYKTKGFDVENPEILRSLEFDWILISVYDKQIQRGIKHQMQLMGIDRRKILDFMGDRI